MSLRKLAKILALTAAGILLIAGVLLLAVKLALDRVPAYQEEIKAWVHQQTGYYIRFARVSPALRWYGPELSFQQLELRSKDNRRVLARARRGRIGSDIWRLIESGKLFAGRVELDEPNIVLERLSSTSFALASEIQLQQSNPSASKLTLDDLPTGTLLIRDGRVTVDNWNTSLKRLELTGVNLDIQRNSGSIAVAFDGRLPRALGGELAITAAARGLGDLTSLSWNADLRTRGVSFRGWRLLLPEYLSTLDAGSGAFDFSARGQGRDLERADFEFAAADVMTRSSDGALTKYDKIGGHLTLTQSNGRWDLFGRRVFASRPGRNYPPSQFDVTWRGDAAGLTALSAHASYLRADTLLPLAGLLRKSTLRQRLIDISPTGEWFDTQLQLSRPAATDEWQFQVRARFRGVGFAPVGNEPGMRGLTGTLSGDQSGGHLSLAATHATIAWPRQWPQAVQLDSLGGTLYWRRTGADLLIATPQLTLQNPDGRLRALASLQIPGNGDSPVLTLVGRVENGNVADAHRYLPRAQMHPNVIAWLEMALVAGRMPRADVILRGPLRQFPFRDGSGLFLARAHLEGMTLNYSKGWPLITDASANAEFRNQGLTVNLLSANAGGLKIDSGDARFADFKTGELQVHATLAGDASAALRFLSATPLNRMAEQAFSQVNGRGALSAGVSLLLPFKNFSQRRVLVHGRLAGVTLSRTGLPLTATALSGEFDVDGAQVARADISGRLLGGPLRIQARAPRGKPVTRTQLDLRGTLEGEALRAALDLPPRFSIRGRTKWRAVLKMVPAPARERALRVSSSLEGLILDLPRPLDKPAGRPLPSWMDMKWPADSGPIVNFELGPIVRATIALQPDARGRKIAHAAVMFGGGAPVFSDQQILNVGGKIGRIDLAGWQKLYRASANGPPLTAYLRSAKLAVGEADFRGYALRDLALDLEASGDRWRLGLEGPGVEGFVMSPKVGASGEPWDLQFDRLRVIAVPAGDAGQDAGRAATGADAGPVITPQNMPALRFRAKDLIWAERQLGDVQASLARAGDGVKLDPLTIKSASYGVEARGDWRGPDGGAGRLTGTLSSTDVAETLAALGYAKVIAAKTGSLDFDLHWLGPPTVDGLLIAKGRVRLALDHGQVLAIKPGAGRVLGLASIAALPRRLALDFSDLTDKGLAFDTVRGDFDLRDGNAYTDDVLLKGPAAEIGLIGRVGLKNKDYDQTAVVTGSIGNSLPIAGALAGGPVVGAAVLLFTQVFKQPLKGLARGYYHITGSWDNPTVERITSADASLNKTEVAK